MRKLALFFAFLFSLGALSAFPWVDDAFRLVTTGSAREIQRAVETDYSFSTFTQTDEAENLLMAALKNSRDNSVIDILLKQAKISPDSKTKSGVTAFMYACQYEDDMDAIKNVLETGAKTDADKARRILAKDKNGNTCFDYARRNELIPEEVLSVVGLYAEEPEKQPLFSEETVPDYPPEAEEPEAEETPEETEIPEEPEPENPPAEEEPAPVPEEVAEPALEENIVPPLPEVNSLVDLAGVAVPPVMTSSIHLYDYAADKAALVAIPAALIAAEEAARNFIPNANNRSSNGRTKLMIAAKKGDIQKIEDLLYSGAQIDARDDDGWTALMYAARFQKDADVTKLLLYKGADRTIKNKYGLTALLLASAYSESQGVVSALLDTYKPDSYEAREAFSYGVSNYNEPKVLQAFVDKKVPLNVPFDGKTPLMVACQTNRNTKIIGWLLDNGASKNQVEASTGKTAFDYARENRKLPHDVTYWSLNPNS